MSRFWRIVAVVLATAGILVGTLILMGSQHDAATRLAQLEQARVELLARVWENRLEAARATFHDLIVQYDVLSALDYPDEWSESRIHSKLDVMRVSWGRESGLPRGIVLFTADGTVHTALGDTARLGEALRALAGSETADLVLLGRTPTQAEVLALLYQPAATDYDMRPGTLVALVYPGSMFSVAGNVTQSWVLLSAPAQPLLSSLASPASVSLSDAVWPLLLAEGQGTLPQPGGATLCFARVHVPGMKPLLLMHAVPRQSVALQSAAPFLIAFGAVLLWVGACWGRRRAAASARAAADVELAPADAVGFRHIFQTIQDPLCVVDQQGHVSRANAGAQEWLRLQKGKPHENVRILHSGREYPAQEFLAALAADPARSSGSCCVLADYTETAAFVTATRLYRDGDGRGPVLVQFHRESGAESVSDVPLAGCALPALDPQSPFPALSVTPDGLVIAFNEAARRTCPRLDESPLLTDILPALQSRDLPALLAAPNGYSFESLFGSTLHQFELACDGECILLYGHPLAASKKLEIELQQAQENFNTLCGLAPVPVLTVDPREHTIIEANAAAADLFGMTPPDLRARPLASLTAQPWDCDGGESCFVALSTGGQVTECYLRYELMKVEGAPTLLVVLEPTPPMPSAETSTADAPAEPDHAAADWRPAAAPPPPLPPGPGMLITLDPTVREVARRLLEKTGHACEAFCSLDDATVWLITHDLKPELVALDATDFDDVTGWIAELRARCGDVPCIAFTDGESCALPDGGQNAFLSKPFNLESLNEALATVNVAAPAAVPA